MGLTAQQFGGAFVDALGVLTAQEAAVVEKELKQSQVVGPQVAAQKEIAPQAAVEVLDDGTGTNGVPSQIVHGYAQRIVTAAQLAMQSRVLLPTARIAQIQRANIEERAHHGYGDLEVRSQVGA